MRSEQVQQSLEKLKNASNEIEGVALVSTDGFIIASILPETLDEERVAAIAAGFQGLSDRCAQDLSKGRPRQFFLQTDQGYIVITDAGQDACLAAFSSRYGKPGMLLLDIRRAAEEIRALM